MCRITCSKQVFMFSGHVSIRIPSSFGFLHNVVGKCSDISEESNAFTFTINEFGQVYNGVTGKTLFCWLHRTIWGSLANHSYGSWKEGTELYRVNGSWDFENSPLSVSTNERCHLDGDCGLMSVSLFKLHCSCLATCGMALFIYLPNEGVTITRLENACCLLSSQNGSGIPRYIQWEPVLPVHVVECSSISTVSLMSQSRRLDILTTILASLGIGRRRRSILCSATSDFSGWRSRILRRCSLTLICIYRSVCPTYTLHTWRECYIYLVI